MSVNINRLREIRDELRELVEEANDIIEKSPNKTIIGRWNSYGLPSLMMAIDEETEWIGGSMGCLEEIIKDLEEDEKEGEGQE